MNPHCHHVLYGFNCAGQVVPHCRLPGACPTCGAGDMQPCRVHEDDELPPCIGERLRDITHDIHRAACSGDHQE